MLDFFTNSQFLDALSETLLARANERRYATLVRTHWEDAVDMNAAAPPLRRNPSSGSHRAKVAVLAAGGATIAAYLSLYQLGLIPSVWDPIFGRGTEHVLTSDVSQAFDRVSLIALRASFLRVVTVAIGLWLMNYGYVAGGYPSAPGYQNLIVVGALICALGIIPTDCLQPTPSWREYYGRQPHQ